MGDERIDMDISHIDMGCLLTLGPVLATSSKALSILVTCMNKKTSYDVASKCVRPHKTVPVDVDTSKFLVEPETGWSRAPMKAGGLLRIRNRPTDPPYD